jgi:hypothetical protein
MNEFLEPGDGRPFELLVAQDGVARNALDRALEGGE